VSDTEPTRGVPVDDGGDAFATSPVVSTVFDEILADVHQGRLLPGQRISDGELAEKLGVSRTPVREAIQRLRQIGIVEASASRFTRVAIVSPRQTADAMVVWVSLYKALVDEVAAVVPPEVVASMETEHGRFLQMIEQRDMQRVAMANAAFFNHLVGISRNPFLQSGITSAAHLIQLGSLHLPEQIDLRTLAEAQSLLIAAARAHDPAGARVAIGTIAQIAVPIEPGGIATDPSV
jgi:DNA-binding GntR family transcriptional regulator